ncbi:hypothetical protein GCM10027174_44590 [Salinifilum aidingensis]
MPDTPWLTREPNPESPLHVLCFPYSAAPANVFDDWRIPGIDLLPIHLPGRGYRSREPHITDMHTLATTVIREVIPHIPGRFALLGHSMGAWVAHAVATDLAPDPEAPQPERLVVLSAPPPRLEGRRFASFHHVSDEELVDKVIEFGGAPPSDRTSIAANVPALRADLDVVGDYTPREVTLNRPISVINGTTDPLVETHDLPAWQAETTRDVSIRLTTGGHFLPHQPANVVPLVADELRTGTTAGSTPEPVALVGMGCRFPGASSPGEFWSLLSEGRDAVRAVPSERPRRATPAMSTGGFLDAVDLFDADFFGFAAHEAQRTDPRLRLLLMTTQEALDDAALHPGEVAGPDTGVWVAESHSDYWDLSQQGMGATMRSLSGGGLKSFLSGRLAYTYDLRGPNVTLDTACSASMVAVHNAVRALRTGEVDTAVVGSTHLLLNPDGSPSPGLSRAFSLHGRCAFADASGDGYIRAEGVAAFVLKRLSDAFADADPIHAVLDGTAINANGQTSKNMVTTSTKAQREMALRALDDAGCRPADVGYVEAHGPGTRVGDAVELQALHEVYGTHGGTCYVGSVKSNIGHAEPSAGAAGLMKTVLALKRGKIPPSLHVNHLNPVIDWSTSGLRVATELAEWPDTERPRAGVSSFGLSGVNGHAIVSPAPRQRLPRARFSQRMWHLASYWLPKGDR